MFGGHFGFCHYNGWIFRSWHIFLRQHYLNVLCANFYIDPIYRTNHLYIYMIWRLCHFLPPNWICFRGQHILIKKLYLRSYCATLFSCTLPFAVLPDHYMKLSAILDFATMIFLKHGQKDFLIEYYQTNIYAQFLICTFY